MKLRPVVPDHLSGKLRHKKRFGVEVDAMPGGFVCSAPMKGKTTASAVWDVMRESLDIRSLLSSSQRKFYKAYAPSRLKLRTLKPLGPITLLKLRWQPPGFDRRMVVEFWPYPDGSRIVELSTKCLPNEALDVALRTRAFLSQNGVNLSGEQQTKTKTALEYFASGIAAT